MGSDSFIQTLVERQCTVLVCGYGTPRSESIGHKGASAGSGTGSRRLARCFLDSFSPACGRTGVGTYGAKAVGHKVLGDTGLAWASAKRPGLLRHSLPTRDLAPATNIFFIFN